MINVAKMGDGQSREGKQLLYILTLVSLGAMVLYYRGQIKLNKMKIAELNQSNAELHLSN
jgi:hypothetical protein